MMNPMAHPHEVVALQGRNEGQPGYPGGAPVVQHTIVNISSEPPKDYILWSLFSFVYSNPCCFGLAALIFSIKARDRKMAGDVSGAQQYASTARCLNIWATVLGCIILLITIILFIINIINLSYSPYARHY